VSRTKRTFARYKCHKERGEGLGGGGGGRDGVAERRGVENIATVIRRNTMPHLTKGKKEMGAF